MILIESVQKPLFFVTILLASAIREPRSVRQDESYLIYQITAMSESSSHWDSVYQTKKPTEVSWHEDSPTHSLALIKSLVEKTSRIIDVGAGQSTLVDGLLDAGFINVTVLDISRTAIEATMRRLGEKANKVNWVVADITQNPKLELYDLWHDRALLHFLTQEEDQQKYLQLLRQSLVVGGYFIISAFLTGGPDRCSGLKCQQYNAHSMQHLLGPDFKELSSSEVAHVTPVGKTQLFYRAVYQRVT